MIVVVAASRSSKELAFFWAVSGLFHQQQRNQGVLISDSALVMTRIRRLAGHLWDLYVIHSVLGKRLPIVEAYAVKQTAGSIGILLHLAQILHQVVLVEKQLSNIQHWKVNEDISLFLSWLLPNHQHTRHRSEGSGSTGLKHGRC